MNYNTEIKCKAIMCNSLNVSNQMKMEKKKEKEKASNRTLNTA